MGHIIIQENRRAQSSQENMCFMLFTYTQHIELGYLSVNEID